MPKTATSSPAQRRSAPASEHAARVAELSSDLLCVTDGEGIYLWLNAAWERLLGWSLEQLTSRPFVDFVHPDDIERTVVETARVAERHYELASFANRYRCRDGSWRWLEWNAYTDGSLWYGSARDITARRRSEDRLRLQATLLGQVDAAVVATDLEGNVLEWNGAAERTYGWSSEEARGGGLGDRVVPSDDPGLGRRVRRIVLEHGAWEGEVWLRRKGGSRFAAYLRASLLRDAGHRPIGLVSASVDITRRKEDARRLRSAQTFLAAITEHVADGLFTMDTDGRLTYMNPAAEKLLGWTEEQLLGQVMHEVIHYRRVDGSPFPLENCPILRTRTDGTPVRDEEDAFIRSDGSALPVSYSAAPFVTEEGVRGTVVVFSDVSERHARELEMRGELEALSWVGRIRDALEEDRFMLYAQPIIDLQTGAIVRHELLLRMVGDDGGVIPPGEFLPAAEEYGLIGDIDRWVVDEAVRLAGGGHAVQLNLSGKSMADRDVADHIKARLQEHGVDPARLVVEITETALITNEAAARQFAEELELIGCGLALDDFGTGYGGFTYLKQLPVQYLKIDREFVQDLASNPASRHVVEAIVNLSRGFGLCTIAEGVEDETALELLRDCGVGFAQGFLISRPYPADEMRAEREGDPARRRCSEHERGEA